MICASDLGNATTKQALAFAEEMVTRSHQVLLSLVGAPSSVEHEGIANVSGLTISFRREFLGWVSRATLNEARAFDPHVLHVFNPRHYAVNVARQFAWVTASAVVVHWEDDELGIRRGVVKRTPIRRVGRLVRRLLCYPWPRQGVFVTGSSVRWVRRYASMCDALTPALAQSVERDFELPCAAVLPIPLTTHRPQPLPLPDLRSARGAAKVAYTGSVHTESIDDFRLALRATALLVEKDYDVGFVYAGVALPRFDLSAIAAGEGLEASRLRSLGYVPLASVRELLRAASVLVQPGRPDRFNRLRLPSKVQAYLESGTPTVMFSVGLGELLRDDEEVVKLHGFSAVELAERVAELLDDRERAKRIGLGGQRAASRLFDRRRNGSALLECYVKALRQRGGDGPGPRRHRWSSFRSMVTMRLLSAQALRSGEESDRPGEAAAVPSEVSLTSSPKRSEGAGADPE
jgi:glycosyltransferase involved in cell wall biosynthesis